MIENCKSKKYDNRRKTPKICVPIVAKTKAEILEEAKALKDIPIDVVEWRVDWFEGVDSHRIDFRSIKRTLSRTRHTSLLFTFRTSKSP